jgi:hypothetical protein
MIARWFILILVTLSVLLTGCLGNGRDGDSIPADVVNNPNSADGGQKSDVLPVITFEEEEHDFGRILEGETVACDFSFTNTGKSDLILAEVSTSCGCTVPSYSKLPIRPGETGKIKVTFNSNGRRGIQSKNVLVVANTQPNTTVLRIKAQVVNPASQQ